MKSKGMSARLMLLMILTISLRGQETFQCEFRNAILP